MVNRKDTDIALAKDALRTLGKEDLLYAHYMGVYARDGAYPKLAEFFEKIRKDERQRTIEEYGIVRDRGQGEKYGGSRK